MAIQARRGAAEFLLGRVELPHGNGEQAVGIERQPLFELKLLAEAIGAKTERSAGAGRQVVFEVRDVRADGGRRLA